MVVALASVLALVLLFAVQSMLEVSAGLEWDCDVAAMTVGGSDRNTWGGFGELICLAHFLGGVAIRVFESAGSGDIHCIFAVGNMDGNVANLYWNGSHYNPVTIFDSVALCSAA